MDKELAHAIVHCETKARNLSYDSDGILKHSLFVAVNILKKCDLNIYKKNDGFFFSWSYGGCGYLTPFEGLLWRFFKVIPKRLFPYSIKGESSD